MNLDDTLGALAGRRVFVTGCTGFKGSWLCAVLVGAGATVSGYATEPPTEPNLFTLASISSVIDFQEADVRDYETLEQSLRESRPEIVLHLAAQPIVLEGYRKPRETYETNVMGTVNLMEAIRHVDSVRSVVNVTTDKVYLNREVSGYGYREDDVLDGYDPYSNSKSCSDLLTQCYRRSFLESMGVSVSTARAGNVIGGGDFARDRIIPDCVRATESGEPLVLRNPASTRPYQHVLEPIFAYLMLAEAQLGRPQLASAYNIGPSEADCVTTRELVELFSREWGEGFRWESASNDEAAPHEASFLRLDSRKANEVLGIRPRWTIEEAVGQTVDWYRSFIEGEDCLDAMQRNIEAYLDQRQNA